MTGSFSFSFSGDDIEKETAVGEDGQVTIEQGAVPQQQTASQPQPQQPQSSTTLHAALPSAFPVQGKPQLPPVHHALGEMLARLPSKVAYSVMEVDLDGADVVRLPRRELWDVRLQLAAEDDELHGNSGGNNGSREDDSGLGSHDVRTGIYEGGFKSWESSVDLVKTLSRNELSPTAALAKGGAVRMIELGCGTALPSLAVFQWASAPCKTAGTLDDRPGPRGPLSLTLADYNPSVLYLVTLPNFILAWALQHQEGSELLSAALSPEEEGELELSEEVKAAFFGFLQASNTSLSFVSGGWSPQFVDLLYDEKLVSHLPWSSSGGTEFSTLVVGAETIYSPFALGSFAETLLTILRREQAERRTCGATSIVAAKRLYFGVGGSLDDFVDRMTASGAVVRGLREETEGVRRGVVQCSLK